MPPRFRLATVVPLLIAMALDVFLWRTQPGFIGPSGLVLLWIAAFASRADAHIAVGRPVPMIQLSRPAELAFMLVFTAVGTFIILAVVAALLSAVWM